MEMRRRGARSTQFGPPRADGSRPYSVQVPMQRVLAEKFHTSEEPIGLLYPGKRLDPTGTVITVPNVATGRPDRQVFKIAIDKQVKAIRAFGANDELIGFYPASGAASFGLMWAE